LQNLRNKATRAEERRRRRRGEKKAGADLI